MKRINQTKLNIASSVLLQLVSGVCGLILPRFVLLYFGSEANGLVSAVAQLLGYTILLEGGIGGVMKAALYKPLAEGDETGISGIFSQISRTFRKISVVFIGFALVLSICMKFLVNTQFDWLYVFSMVLILSAHYFFSYYVGLPHRLLMTADQKLYVIQFTQIAVTIVNFLLCLLVMYLGGGIHAVKLTMTVVFLLNPLVQRIYVKRHYKISAESTTETSVITQKRDGVLHHLSFFVHRNTDVVLLSLLGSLNAVSVYSVYNTVIYILEQLLLSVSYGISSLVGRMVARKEVSELNRVIDRYEALNNAAATAVATVCAILILPFVSIYTGGVTDAQYYQPVFAMLMIAGSYAYSVRHPLACVITAAGHYKQTNVGAVGEGLINLGVSLTLVKPFGPAGVALGTFAAMAFRTGYSVWYLSKHLLYRPVRKFLWSLAWNLALAIALISWIPRWIAVDADNIWGLVLCAVKVSAVVFPLFIGMNALISFKAFRKESSQKS